MKRYISLIGFMVFAAVFLIAQTNKKSSRPDVIENIEANSKVIIKQDPKLDKLINDHVNRKEEVSGPYSGPGYRVQVFSSNAQRTAKDEAYNIERRLRSAFPGYGVYRIYSSPFWKVRIGDFRSLAEARAFRSELIKAFPEYSRETYTVRESKVTVR